MAVERPLLERQVPTEPRMRLPRYRAGVGRLPSSSNRTRSRLVSNSTRGARAFPPRTDDAGPSAPSPSGVCTDSVEHAP